MDMEDDYLRIFTDVAEVMLLQSYIKEEETVITYSL